MFKFENTDIKCLNQISDLFVIFIDFYNAVNE